jgi:hypothetical protein
MFPTLAFGPVFGLVMAGIGRVLRFIDEPDRLGERHQNLEERNQP